MLDHIIGFSIRNKLLIGLAVFALIGFGAYQVTKLPIDAVPDITDNQVQVITIAPSFGATDIERLVTFPIEQANNNISGIKEIRSFSRFGLSLVTIVFTDEVDLFWARQQVAERLVQVQGQIPEGIGTPELGPITTGLGEIYQYVVRPAPGYEDRYSATELRTIQDWVVRRQLLGVPGVAEVSSFGGKLRQIEVAIDPNRLKAHGLDITTVFNALQANNGNTGGAYIEKGPTVLYIRTEGLLEDMDAIRKVPVAVSAAGLPILVRDVAEVREGHATRYGAMTYNNDGEVAGAIVMMLKGANSNEVIKNVKERMEQIRATLPEGVVVEPFLDRTKMVNNAINTVEKNLLEGALIVVFILVLFLGNVRAGFLVASVIPLAMLFAIILMNLFGVSGNLMSLGALDFGLIVDGAVIIVEAVMHQLTHSKTLKDATTLSRSEMDGQVKQAASRMMNSAVFGQVIILIVYLPIFTLQGIEGKMFKPMAQTVAFALLGAFILSLTYVPMMSALILNRKVQHQPNLSDRIMAKVERFYQHALQHILSFPKMVVGGVVVLFAAVVFLLSTLGGEFIPSLEEGDFAVETRVLTGSNLNTSIEHTQKAVKVLLKFPEVEKVVTKLGSGEIPTDPMPIEASDMMVILKDKDEWTTAETFNELADTMAKALQDVPGVVTGFQYPVQMRFNELMTGARQDVVLKIFGENLDTLATYAQRLGGIVNTVEGSQDLFVEPMTGMPQLIITYNRDALARYGLTVTDANRVVNMAYAGQKAGSMYEGERRFDLVVRIKDVLDRDVRQMGELPIPTPTGLQVPLNELAKVEVKNGPNQIQREDAKRRIIVGFNVRGRDVQSIVDELQKKVDAQLNLPAGYYVTYGGAFENLNAAKQRLLIAVPVSLILIFLLLYFAFGSIKHGLLIYTAIPLSAIGGILLLWLRDMPFSISAGIGFIALFGVAVLNGIVLVAEFNRLKNEGMNDLNRIVLMGTKVRLRPVLMTAFVASLGFLPMALSKGVGAEVQRPLATVVIGGLLIATFLTLFVLPILYIMFESTGKKGPKTGKVAAVLILFGLASFNAQAQQPIPLNSAIDTALSNNLSVKAQRLATDEAQALIRSAADIPMTNVSAEVGQMNSSYVDTRFGVQQSIAFPTVYAAQKQVYQSDYRLVSIGTQLTEIQMKAHVTELYQHLLVLSEKQRLLNRADSLSSKLMEVAELRHRTGETDRVELAAAQTHRADVQLQLSAINKEWQRSLLEFNMLLQAKQPLRPTDEAVVLPLVNINENNEVVSHPELQAANADLQKAVASTKAERAKLLPTIDLGYYNTSMRGSGADNIIYDASTRFHMGQVGLGIPLFFGSQQARVKAGKLGQQAAQTRLEATRVELNNRWQQAVSDYRAALDQLQLMESTALPSAKALEEAASLRISVGDIDPVDWVMLMDKVVALRMQHLDAIDQLNNSIIQIQYYQTQP